MLSLLLWSSIAVADITPDPAAQKVFAEFLAAYRAHPALTATATTTISALDRSDPDAVKAAKGKPVEITLVHGRVAAEAPAEGQQQPADRPRRGVLTVQGFTIWLGDGFITAVHESNPEAYWRVSDNESPYYALLSLFFDLPYPDLALAFGEDDPADVLMQLHPRSPDLVPVGVVDETVEGAARRTIKLAAPGERADLVIDTARGLPLTMTLVFEKGPMVTDGTTIIYEHSFRYEVPGKPLAVESVAFDPKARQKLDAFRALVKAPEPAPGDPGGHGGHALVGKPLPNLKLPLLQGGTLDLGAPANRVLVLDFWATWCGPCKAAFPRLHEIAAALKAEELPVTFYTVNVFEQVEELDARRLLVGNFWRQHKYTLPVALDLDGAAGRAFQVPGIPMSVVVRSDGVVHAVHVGFQPDKLIADIREAIAVLEVGEVGE